MNLNNKWLFLAVLIALTALFPLSSGAAIDGGYEGTAFCLGCHDGSAASDKTSFIESGHAYKFRQTNGADCSAGACDAISNILPTPAIATLDTISTTGVIDLTIGLTDIVAPIGDIDWKDIDAVIGGWGWKSRYVALDTGGLLGGNAPSDETGLVWTGSAVQWNVLQGTWGGYHAGENKVYNCSRCHNTNGTRDLTQSRTELAGIGAYGSIHTYDGVQCEGCHANSVRVENGANSSNATLHGVNPLANPMGVADGGGAAMCGRCHNRDSGDEPDLSGAATKGGYIRHHEQYDEMVGAGGTGVHASLGCTDCHDPHIRTHKVPAATATALGITDNALSAEARGAVVSCESCHPGHTTGQHTGVQCIDCHMAEATKSATAVTGVIGKKGDVKTHIFKINPDELATDTAASNPAEGYLSLNYACAKCHDSSMPADYSGIELTIAELAAAANDYHTPPVNQNLGFFDTELGDLLEADCRVCHSATPPPGIPVDPTYNPDRHHLTVDTAIPVGECADEGIPCQVDADCTLPNDYCISDSQAPNATLTSPASGNYECLTCHTLVWDPVTMTSQFSPFRDCQLCHITEFQPDHPDRAQEPNTHHRTVEATGGDCVHCHGNLVDGLTDGHTIPTYQPSLVTPWPSGKPNGGDANARGTLEGNCNYCHDSSTTDSCDEVAGTCVDSGNPCAINADCNGPIITNHDTHHFTGLPGVVIGPGTEEACLWCHQPLFPGADIGVPKYDGYDIRSCENCHGISSLHNIQVDSQGDGSIDPGSEIARWGHIGNNADCNGCHGFTAATAPESGPVIPDIASVDDLTMTAGTDTTITLTGSAFTNTVMGGALTLTSNVELSASDDSTTTLTPDSITEYEIVVTLPGSLAAGNYDLRAVKGPKKSNPVVVSVTPEVVMTDSSCNRKKGVLTITGSGFGQKVEGTDDYISVDVGGQTADIISWSDTEIRASVSSCKNADVTVNALYGSATDSGSGGGKPDKPCKGKKCSN
ncbi:MAG: IPT/TIG domain-containing protein [Nitrospirota bacterium]